jgi:O-antigen/teichoic acid export membrane protein
MSLKKIKESIVNLGALFISKVGGVLVVLFFMPLFLKILGVEQFGVVAVILSMQALLMMLDLGTSTLISRDVAIFGKNSVNSFSIWRNSEVLLTTFYALVLPFAIFACLLGSFGTLSVFSTVFSVFLFWAMVLQNLSQTVLLSTNSFKTVSVIQLIGGLARAGFTVLLLKKLDATIAIFIIAQLFVAILQLLVTRIICNSIFSEIEKIKVSIKEMVENCVNLLKRSKPLLLFGLAGAAVMQLDKPIIATFISAKEVSTYFLAMTFCMVPVGVLAGPVAQYFQPKYNLLTSTSNYDKTQEILLQFVSILIFLTVIPSVFLWIYRDSLIHLWINDNQSALQIANYAKILLPSIVVGSLGYIPFTLLTAEQDYRFQAKISLAMTLTTLFLALIFAWKKNIHGVCYVYSIYHILSTCISWSRACFLRKIRKSSIKSIVLSIKLILIIVPINFLIKYFLDLIYHGEYQFIMFF